jgi:hypothetical protein
MVATLVQLTRQSTWSVCVCFTSERFANGEAAYVVGVQKVCYVWIPHNLAVEGLGFLGSDDVSLGVWSATFRRNVLYLYSGVKQFEKTRQFEGW